MPVASGLIDRSKDKRAAIDLVHRAGPSSFSLIELKLASDNPLYAAMEILRYGLLLAWSKENQAQLGYRVDAQPVLAATGVTLIVPAPNDYYRGLDLTHLRTASNVGLREFCSTRCISIEFEFCRYSADIDASMASSDIQSAVRGRSSVWVT